MKMVIASILLEELRVRFPTLAYRDPAYYYDNNNGSSWVFSINGRHYCVREEEIIVTITDGISYSNIILELSDPTLLDKLILSVTKWIIWKQ